MPKFSARSTERLETCDERLVTIFNEVVKHFECTILEGGGLKRTRMRHLEPAKES